MIGRYLYGLDVMFKVFLFDVYYVILVDVLIFIVDKLEVIFNSIIWIRLIVLI